MPLTDAHRLRETAGPSTTLRFGRDDNSVADDECLSCNLSLLKSRIVIPRACDFFDPFVFFVQRSRCFSTPPQSRHPERSASEIDRITEGFMARSRRTPAMLVARCSSKLSGRKLQGKLKKLQAPTGAQRSRSGPAVRLSPPPSPPEDLRISFLTNPTQRLLRAQRQAAGD